MKDKILNKKKSFSLWEFIIESNFITVFIVHVLLGWIGLFTKYVYIIWFYALIISFISSSSLSKKKIIPYFLAYIIPAELFGRILWCTPFIPYEMAKYFGFLLLIYAISINNSKSRGSIGLLLLSLLLPGILLAVATSNRLWGDLAFNVLGGINLCLAVFYFSNIQFTKQEVANIFRVIIISALPILAYSIIRAPSIESYEFKLGANSALTGGFGSNQVSSILGLAFGMGIWLWLMQVKLSKKWYFNLGIPALFFGWALLSFSRGGVLTPIAGLLLIIFLVKKGENKFQVRKVRTSFLLTGFIFLPLIFYTLNEITDNQLILRYQGETAGTLKGVKEKDVGQLTSGRSEILLNDIEIWMDNFVFGVGVGQSKDLRLEYGHPNIAAHVEVSRLLSEHGLLGLIFSIIFLFKPIFVITNQKSSFSKSLVIMCFTIAILTSMHSAMRTLITPFFYGLAFIRINEKEEEENSIHREQVN